MDCELWRMSCETWTSKEWMMNYEVRAVKYELWNIYGDDWTVNYEVLSVEYEVWTAKYEH